MRPVVLTLSTSCNYKHIMHTRASYAAYLVDGVAKANV